MLGTDNLPSEDKPPAKSVILQVPPALPGRQSVAIPTNGGFLAEPKATKSSSKRIFLHGLEDNQKPPSAKEHSVSRRKSERDQQGQPISTGKFGELVSPKALKSILTPKNKQKVGAKRPSVFASVSELASPKNFRISSRVSIITDKTKLGPKTKPDLLMERSNVAEAEADAVRTHRSKRVIAMEESTFDYPIGGLVSFVRVVVPEVGETGSGVLDSQIDPILTDFFNRLTTELSAYHPAAKFSAVAELKLLMEDPLANIAWVPLHDVFARAEDEKRKKKPKRKRPPTSSEDPPTESGQGETKRAEDSEEPSPDEPKEHTRGSSKSKSSKPIKMKPGVR